MKKLVYTVQGLQASANVGVLAQQLTEALRPFGCDGNVHLDTTAGTLHFEVPRKAVNAQMEASVNAVLAAHGMALVTPPGVRYFSYVGPQSDRKGVPASIFAAVLVAAVALTLVFTMTIALLLAVLLNRKMKGRIIYRSIFSYIQFGTTSKSNSIRISFYFSTCYCYC